MRRDTLNQTATFPRTAVHKGGGDEKRPPRVVAQRSVENGRAPRPRPSTPPRCAPCCGGTSTPSSCAPSRSVTGRRRSCPAGTSRRLRRSSPRCAWAGKRLVVNVPPRHLKSLAASIALPAWLLGHDPRLRIVNATYAQDLSDTFARDCWALMSAPWYRGCLRDAPRRDRRRCASSSPRGRLSARDLDWRRAHRPRRGRDRDRRSAQSRRRDVRDAPRRGQCPGSTERLRHASTTRRRAPSSSSCSACTRTISSAMC